MDASFVDAKAKHRITFGVLTLDKQQQAARLGDNAVELTRKEFALLWILASEPGRAFHRRELLNEVWGADRRVGARTIDAHLTKVRRKLEKSQPRTVRIETIWGFGYRLRDGIDSR
jgi:DNA-binding response OmpR family regulator